MEFLNNFVSVEDSSVFRTCVLSNNQIVFQDDRVFFVHPKQIQLVLNLMEQLEKARSLFSENTKLFTDLQSISHK